MPNFSKKPKLNVHAKALFICHTPRTIKKYKPAVGDYLKFPKISKQFLFAANSHRIFSLGLNSFCSYSQRYRITLEIQNKSSAWKYSVLFTADFEGLKNLSKWLHIKILGVYLYSVFGRVKSNEEICAFRHVWSEIYPDAKINFDNENIRENFDIMPVLVEELSGRLHNYEYRSEPLINTGKKLTLNKCVLNNKINIVDFTKLMQKEHKIKTLKVNLKRKDDTPLFSSENLNDFPTNFILKELEITHEMQSAYEKCFDPEELESFLEFFPNLTRFDLNLRYWRNGGRGGVVGVDFKKEVKESMSNALNFIYELRMILAQKMPLIELNIFYEIHIMDAEKIGFENFEDWVKALPNHPELAGLEKIGPISKLPPYICTELRKEQYYQIFEGSQHIISLEWEHRNSKGKIYMSIDDKQEEESEEEESEEMEEY